MTTRGQTMLSGTVNALATAALTATVSFTGSPRTVAGVTSLGAVAHAVTINMVHESSLLPKSQKRVVA